jgi:hypothetical protein
MKEGDLEQMKSVIWENKETLGKPGGDKKGDLK